MLLSPLLQRNFIERCRESKRILYHKQSQLQSAYNFLLDLSVPALLKIPSPVFNY
jgi:hypothetical protein